MNIRRESKSEDVIFTELYKGYNELNGEFIGVEITLTMVTGKSNNSIDLAVIDGKVNELWKDWGEMLKESVPDLNDTNRLKFIADTKNYVKSRCSDMSIILIDIEAWAQQGEEIHNE